MIVISRHVFFVFKQKTAYEMRISDWSSDVCSSDLNVQIKNVMANSITNVSIRGIGLNDYAVNNNPAAGIYVDNVYLVSPAMLTFGFYDVDRIEILKGPQGDLYGRTPTAGGVNLIIRKPS